MSVFDCLVEFTVNNKGGIVFTEFKHRREGHVVSGHSLGHFRRPAYEIISVKLGVGGFRYLAALCGGQLGLAAVNDPNQLEFSRHDGDGYLNRHALIGERYLLIAEL